MSKRSAKVLKNGQWIIKELKDIKKDDVFKVIDGQDEMPVIFEAMSDAKLNNSYKGEVWEIPIKSKLTEGELIKPKKEN